MQYIFKLKQVVRRLKVTCRVLPENTPFVRLVLVSKYPSFVISISPCHFVLKFFVIYEIQRRILLRWHYSPMRTFASLMAPSQSFHSIRLFRGHILGFLAVSFLQWQVVSLSPNPQPGGPAHPIYKPPGQGGPAIPPGTGYPFWSPFTTCMVCSATILFPGHHTGKVLLLVWYLPFDLSGLGGPTSSYDTAGIALWVIGTHKPRQHDQVEAPSVGPKTNYRILNQMNPLHFHIISLRVTLPSGLCCVFGITKVTTCPVIPSPFIDHRHKTLWNPQYAVSRN
jgi:hypothetical protein